MKYLFYNDQSCVSKGPISLRLSPSGAIVLIAGPEQPDPVRYLTTTAPQIYRIEIRALLEFRNGFANTPYMPVSLLSPEELLETVVVGLLLSRRKHRLNMLDGHLKQRLILLVWMAIRV